MLKVGVFLNIASPEDGGASTLLATIKNEIEDSADTDIKDTQFIILYCGGLQKKYKRIVDNTCYINISRITPLKKILNKLEKRLFGINTEDKRLNYVAEKESIDLFWITSPCQFSIDYPYIFTIWDLAHRSVPYFPEVTRTGWIWDDREFIYQKMVYKASYIITGNENGKKEILENYSIPSDKIRISSFPVAAFCHGKEIKPKFLTDEHYFFYPAQFWPEKNHIVIIDALEILRDKFNKTPIVYMVGSDKGNKAYIESEILKRGLNKQVIIPGFVSNEELKYLYTHAVGMIFASLVGPNNMPPIEATYLGCPVIITNLDGHKEQLQDTALYFNGYKPEELAEHMKTLLTDGVVRSAIIEKEKVLGKQFGTINYFKEIKKIIKEFSLIRRTWGVDYRHL